MGEGVVNIRPVWGRKETWEMAAWPRRPEGTGFGRRGRCLPLILLNHSVLLPHNLGPFPLLDIRDLYLPHPPDPVCITQALCPLVSCSVCPMGRTRGSSDGRPHLPSFNYQDVPEAVSSLCFHRSRGGNDFLLSLAPQTFGASVGPLNSN